MSLAEFLLARIAEDEAAAAEAGADQWQVADQRKVRWVRNGGTAHGWVAIADLATASEHIARWDPARVLAECEAKRRIIGQHGAEAEDVGWKETRTICATCRYDSGLDAYDYPCPTLIALASIYASHPDYDPAWRP